MKKILIFTTIIFFSFLFSCKNERQKTKASKQEIESINKLKKRTVNIEISKPDNDTTKTNKLKENILNAKKKKIEIYELNSYQKSKNKSTGFIILTDSYLWSEHPDSIVVSDKYLGNNTLKEHHKLDKKYRKRFLNKMNIKETDKVYIYNYSLDSIYTYSVSNLSLLARINPYGANQPVSQYDYLIGFDLDGKNLDMNAYYNSFVYVGKNNPFVIGEIQPIIWKKTEKKTLPLVKQNSEIINRLQNYKPNDIYKFTYDNFHYFIQDYGYKARHLVVLSKNNQIIFNEVFFSEESKSLTPMNIGEFEKLKTEQWTGKIFKDKPPVMFGFFYESFGCSWINVLSESKEIIPILCDNRH